jgi:hypothetical protein
MFARSVELELATIHVLSTMLGTSSGPAAAIFAALRNANLQLAAIEAVAGEVLSDRDGELFVAVTDIAQRANADRNRFAHWHWGYLGNDPDALCIQDPKFRRRYDLETLPLIAEAMESRDGWDRMMAAGQGRQQTDHVQVYRASDLDDSNDRMEQAKIILRCFQALIDQSLPGHGEQKLYDDLVAMPGVAEALTRHRKNRPKN